MPKKLKNPAARHINLNYSIDSRADDFLNEEADLKGLSKSAMLNIILKERYGIEN